jgi:hypothetical protein
MMGGLNLSSVCMKKGASHRKHVINTYFPLYINPQILRFFSLKIIYSKFFMKVVINYF